MASREPFSRQGAGDSSDGRSLDERLIGAYEFAAAEYGWAPQKVEEELSDEQLVAYLDAATDRLTRTYERDFEANVEAVRAGTIFAHDKKAARKWARRRIAKTSRGLTGMALEQAVRGIAEMFPKNVIYGTS